MPCECNPVGTIGTCAVVGGACTCKPGFAGRKCAECAPGYSGPNCVKCPCDLRGTMPGGECEAHCQCKVWANELSFIQLSHGMIVYSYHYYLLTSSFMPKVNSVINAHLDISDYLKQTRKDVQSVIAQALEIFAKVAILLQIQ